MYTKAEADVAEAQPISPWRGRWLVRRYSTTYCSSGIGAGVAAGVLGTWPGQAFADEKQGITDTEILIGALGPITGPTAFIGGPARDGMALAIEKINEAGPINGRKLRLVYEHAATPAESVAAAKKLTESDNVYHSRFGVGQHWRGCGRRLRAVCEDPDLQHLRRKPIIREPFARNVSHGSMPDPVVTAREWSTRCSRRCRTSKKVGVLAGTYAFPQANLKAMMPILQKRNLEVVLEQFDAAATDYTAQLVSFARQRVQAIIVLGSFTEAGFAIKQAPSRDSQTSPGSLMVRAPTTRSYRSSEKRIQPTCGVITMRRTSRRRPTRRSRAS